MSQPSMVDVDNAPRDLNALATLSRAIRYRLALNIPLFQAESDEEKAWIALPEQHQAQEVLNALLARDSMGGQPQQPPPQALPPQAPPIQQQPFQAPPLTPTPLVVQSGAPVSPTPMPQQVPPAAVAPPQQPYQQPPQPQYQQPAAYQPPVQQQPPPAAAPPVMTPPPSMAAAPPAMAAAPPAPPIAGAPATAPPGAQPPQPAPQTWSPPGAPPVQQQPAAGGWSPPGAQAPPVAPPAAVATRQPVTPTDPSNAGAAPATGAGAALMGIQSALYASNAKIDQLQGIILGMARTQRVLGILCLEIGEGVLKLPKPQLIKLIEKAKEEGEPEKYFEQALGKD